MSREQLAAEHGMSMEYVNWFFDHKKEGCGNVWFMMMAAMWEGWQAASKASEQQLLELSVKLANVESKCAEVVAENAGAKKVISECREYFIAGVMNRIRPTNEGYLHMICDTFADETPATDAYLAEVRAEVIEWLDAEISAIDPVYRGDPSYEHDAYWMKTEVQDLIESSRKVFAAQLRQGEKQ